VKNDPRAGSSAVERRLYKPDVSAARVENHNAIRPAPRSVYASAPTGERFGRWVVLGLAGYDGKHRRWRVRCDCGAEHTRQAASIVTGSSTQCVTCSAREVAAARALPVPSRDEHGERRPEWRAWRGMIARCSDPTLRFWYRYGGRGIRVCERWETSFAAFYGDVGPRPGPGYSIDRVDNDGDYEPGNVRWATALEQARNTRRNIVLEIDGRSQCLAAWAAERGVQPQFISNRLRRGWSVREAVMAPKGATLAREREGAP